MYKQQLKSTNDWIKKSSKSRPGKFYYFNTRTGESIWEAPKLVQDQIEQIPKKTKGFEHVINSKSVVICKTPAQDRLRKLQEELTINNSKKLKIINALKDKNIEVSCVNIIPPPSTTKKESLMKPKQFDSIKINKSEETLTEPKRNDKTSESKIMNAVNRLYNNTVNRVSDLVNNTFIKNLANDRLNKLRKRLSENNETTNIKGNKVEIYEKPNQEKIKKIVENNNIKQCKRDTTEKDKGIHIDDDVVMIEPVCANNNPDDSFMEWEPIPEEVILQEIQLIRSDDNKKIIHIPSFNEKEIINGSQFERKFNFFIVIDTNIFLSNIKFLQNLVYILGYNINYPLLIVPYIVLQELDRIKHRGDKSLSQNASNSIKYLNIQIIKPKPLIQGQNLLKSNESIINIENPDDKILNCCLQIKRNFNEVILLSNDINLRNKTLFNNIAAYSKLEFEKQQNNILKKYLKIDL